MHGEVIGKIGAGLCVLVGAGRDDTADDVQYLAEKLVNLRIFPDDEDKMNRSLLDVRGELLAVSQFTLFGDARKGRRPSFIDAMEPSQAELLFGKLVEEIRRAGVAEVATGKFGAIMEVDLVNAGPVTILLDSRRGF